MQKHIKNLLKANLKIIAICITIAIAYLSLAKIKSQGVSISNIDKINHFIAYFTLTITWLLAIAKPTKEKKVKYIVFFMCVFYGIIIEVLQTTLTNYREASFFDAVANSVGALLALFIFSVKFEKKQSI